MKLISAHQVLELPINIRLYNTFWKRFRGLMFRLKPLEYEGILLEPCNSIHMFFMFVAIDVVFLNGEGKIVYLQKNVKPWTVIFPIKQAKAVLELPVGTIAIYRLKVSDRIEV